VTLRLAAMPTHAFACKECPRLTIHGHEIAKACCRESWVTFFTKRPPISPIAQIVWCRAREERAVTNVVRGPMRPAARWTPLVSMVSGAVIATYMPGQPLNVQARIPLTSSEGEIVSPTSTGE
jgi:hypothetical protein